MLSKEIADKCKNMSYEQQKEVMSYLNNDNQAYDDSCNIVEVVVEAVVNVVKVIAKNLF